MSDTEPTDVVPEPSSEPTEAAPEPPRSCIKCDQLLPRTSFSRKQWQTPDAKRKCSDCVVPQQENTEKQAKKARKKASTSLWLHPLAAPAYLCRCCISLGAAACSLRVWSGCCISCWIHLRVVTCAAGQPGGCMCADPLLTVCSPTYCLLVTIDCLLAAQ